MFSLSSMLSLLLLLAGGVSASIVCHRHEDNILMKELTTMTMRDYGTNLANGTAAQPRQWDDRREGDPYGVLRCYEWTIVVRFAVE